jgi:signal transduction histidine kinase
LDLSKIEAGRLEVHPERFRLDTLIEECVRTVEPMIKQEFVALSSNVAGALPELYSDRDKLKQIVLNLLSNAIKFTERGRIFLEAKSDKDWIAIDVADTGPGIPRDKFDFIFEEFRQIDGGATRPRGGTGLGLSISRHLARLLGGELFVESIVGQGSTFTIRVPPSLQVTEELPDQPTRMPQQARGAVQ